VKQIVNLFSAAQPLTVEQARAAVKIDYSDTPLKRYRILYTQDHKQDKLSFFIDKLHNINKEQYDKILSFFIYRFMYFVFFGKLSRPSPRSFKEISLLISLILAYLGDN
jgi:hypothetical protein